MFLKTGPAGESGKKAPPKRGFLGAGRQADHFLGAGLGASGAPAGAAAGAATPDFSL